jgi:hypothetical protein
MIRNALIAMFLAFALAFAFTPTVTAEEAQTCCDCYEIGNETGCDCGWSFGMPNCNALCSSNSCGYA